MRNHGSSARRCRCLVLRLIFEKVLALCTERGFSPTRSMHSFLYVVFCKPTLFIAHLFRLSCFLFSSCATPCEYRRHHRCLVRACREGHPLVQCTHPARAITQIFPRQYSSGQRFGGHQQFPPATYNQAGFHGSYGGPQQASMSGVPIGPNLQQPAPPPQTAQQGFPGGQGVPQNFIPTPLSRASPHGYYSGHFADQTQYFNPSFTAQPPFVPPSQGSSKMKSGSKK